MMPTYQEIMLPLLTFIKDGKEHSFSEIVESLSTHFRLTEEELRELLPSGTQPVFRNRVGWARTYLKNAGLISSPKRAYVQITSRGKELLKENPSEITSNFLNRYDEFKEFKNRKKPKNKTHESKSENENTHTPEEILEYTYQKINNDLSVELLDMVKNSSPAFFERLVIDLLIAMGYGGSRKEAGQAVGKSGDGGIDGIINEDKLGLDVIYLQAKKWENPVPIKEIRDFTGALASKKAKKGIFITTSSFPKSVYEFVKQVEYKIILIDGQKLADLMIENNVGLTITNAYFIKAIDLDYFEDN